MFQTELVPDPSYITTLDDFDMFGYSVTSGRFLSKNKILYAGGAPRGANYYGKASICFSVFFSVISSYASIQLVL